MPRRHLFLLGPTLMAPGQVLSCCSRPLSSAFAPTHSLGIRWCPLHTGHVSDGVAQSLPQQKAEDGADFSGCWKAYRHQDRQQPSCGLAPRRPSAKGRFTGICITVARTEPSPAPRSLEPRQHEAPLPTALAQPSRPYHPPTPTSKPQHAQQARRCLVTNTSEGKAASSPVIHRWRLQ